MGFDALCDQQAFAAVYLEYGALIWPGGVDLAPLFYFIRLQSHRVGRVDASADLDPEG